MQSGRVALDDHVLPAIPPLRLQARQRQRALAKVARHAERRGAPPDARDGLLASTLVGALRAIDPGLADDALDFDSASDEGDADTAMQPPPLPPTAASGRSDALVADTAHDSAGPRGARASARGAAASDGPAAALRDLSRVDDVAAAPAVSSGPPASMALLAGNGERLWGALEPSFVRVPPAAAELTLASTTLRGSTAAARWHVAPGAGTSDPPRFRLHPPHEAAVAAAIARSVASGDAVAGVIASAASSSLSLVEIGLAQSQRSWVQAREKQVCESELLLHHSLCVRHGVTC